MESLILEILPLERRPVLVRYAISGLFVLVAFLSRYVLGSAMQGSPYLLFIPAVFASSLLFDRGSGFIATGLSALRALYFFVAPVGAFWPVQPGDMPGAAPLRRDQRRHRLRHRGIAPGAGAGGGGRARQGPAAARGRAPRPQRPPGHHLRALARATQGDVPRGAGRAAAGGGAGPGAEPRLR